MERVSTYLPIGRCHALATNAELLGQAAGVPPVAEVLGFSHQTDILQEILAARPRKVVSLAGHGGLSCVRHRYLVGGMEGRAEETGAGHR